jgi:hypothetical protein
MSFQKPEKDFGEGPVCYIQFESDSVLLPREIAKNRTNDGPFLENPQDSHYPFCESHPFIDVPFAIMR